MSPEQRRRPRRSLACALFALPPLKGTGDSMSNAVRILPGIALTICLAGCSAPVSPSPLNVAAVGSAMGSLHEPSPSPLPAWILEPATLPDGRVGKNNCTFAFPTDYQWDVHPDGGCWQHNVADGWTRQQFQRMHIPAFASCGGGPGDATAIRVCRAGGAGQPSPCLIDPRTGPNGCSRCVVNPTCH